MAYPYDRDPLKCIEMISEWATWEYDTRPVYMELRFFRTFFIAAAKWCKDDNDELTQLLHYLQALIRDARTEFHSRVCANQKFRKVLAFDNFDKISLLKPQIHQVLQRFISSSFKPSLNCELVEEHLKLLIENFGDVLQFQKALTSSQKEDINFVQEKLEFLKNFLFFVKKWSVEQDKLQAVLNHIEVVADIATTYVSFPCLGNTSDKDMSSGVLFDLLIQSIKPNKPEVTKAYVHLLKGLVPPGSYSYLMYEFIGTFVDFLLQDLNEMLQSQATTSAAPVKDHFETLHKELRFILTFLISPPEQPIMVGKLDDISAVIETTVMEAGSIVRRFHKRDMNENSAKELELEVIGLSQEVKTIQPKSGEIYLNIRKLPTESIFPQIDVLGFLNSLLENVQQLMHSKIDSIALVKLQLQTVLQELEFFKSFLKNVADHDHVDEDDQLNVLSTHVIHLAYRIEYIIDSLLVKPSSLWHRLLDDVILETIFIKTQILENLDEKTSALRGHETPSVFARVPSEGNSSLFDEELVGFEDEGKIIVAKLTKGPAELDIISIIGMPGLGKTTLAKKVFSDESVSQRFQVRAWCCVSQLYQKKNLLLEILCQFVEDTYKISKMDEQELAHELKRRLQRRRYLIVTDDIWKTDVWDDLKMCFPDDRNGSRIIMTTRLNEVALYAKQCSEPHCLRFLSEQESWSLLQKKLFHAEDCPTELLKVGKEISDRCQGLPLYIVLVAGILDKMDVKPNNRIEDKANSWKRVADSLSSKLDSDGEHNWMDILELSYKHLPHHLKSCFLYFGAFLEDQEIPVSKLIILWISEGFVQKAESKKQEDIAEEYLMNLISRSLVMVDKRRSLGGVKSCRVHDLLHKFCLEKAEEGSLLQVTTSKPDKQVPLYSHSYNYGFDTHDIGPPRTPIIHEQRRLRIICDRRQFVLSRPSGPTVRSLLLHATRRAFSGEKFNISFVCHNFKLLKVLDLECIHLGDVFVEEISLLVHLRFLAVRGGMQSIPSSIVKLWNLETLLVKGEKGEVSLPEAIFQMKKLRHLHINDRVIFDVTLCQLHHVITFSTPSLSFYGNKMKSFPGIRKLRCIFLESWGYCMELRKSCNRFPILDFLNQLESLKVLYHGRILSPCKFSFPSNLKKLTLSKFRLPWSEISAISALENLEVLKLVFRAFEGDRWDVNDVEFKRLKFLKLDFLNIARWNASDDAFPSLECLLLQKCKRLEEIPSGFGYNTSLQMIQVKWCSSSAAKSATEIKDIQVNEMGNHNFRTSIQQADRDPSA
ncbi:hypothetical protein HAX54_023448 [Datura stramonium]|uniref:Uncharacterized protein n=1 Tax=Datura stramonium TaxID=4076 RepID=A0ABS8S4W6_DATST|nr:hypothetical protein [Datura stramonium]